MERHRELCDEFKLLIKKVKEEKEKHVPLKPLTIKVVQGMITASGLTERTDNQVYTDIHRCCVVFDLGVKDGTALVFSTFEAGFIKELVLSGTMCSSAPRKQRINPPETLVGKNRRKD